MINNQKDLKKERLSEALRENLKKRKEFLKRLKKEKHERFI
jgi:preprotein translocase subunit Sss1